MAAPKVRSDYQGLRQIASQFGAQAEASRQTMNNLKKRVEKLRGGDWVGKGANKFYGEMDSAVFPTFNRLTAAMEKAQRTTLKISEIMKNAEDEAASLFRLDGGPGGGPGGGGSGGPGGGGSGGPPSWFKGKGKGFEWGKQDGKKYGKPSLGFKYVVDKGSLYGDAKAADGWSAIGGEAGIELSVEGLKKGKVGIFAEGYGAKIQGDTILAGDKDLGLTAAGDIQVGRVGGFAGIKDGSLGASIGGSIISAKGEIGTNISGYNVGVNAEVGLKAELGFQIGKKTQIKLPFVTLGFSFGSARE